MWKSFEWFSQNFGQSLFLNRDQRIRICYYKQSHPSLSSKRLRLKMTFGIVLSETIVFAPYSDGESTFNVSFRCHVLWKAIESTCSSIDWKLKRVCTYVLRYSELRRCIEVGCGFRCLWECFSIHWLLMRFCFFLKLIKEQEQNEESFQKKNKARANNRNETTKTKNYI